MDNTFRIEIFSLNNQLFSFKTGTTYFAHLSEAARGILGKAKERTMSE